MISSEIGKEVIKKELPLVPKLPGVYRMLNEKNEILYVGKAKNLPNRLKSYVAEKNHIIRTERMLSQTRKLEITTTSNESEALLLEANLIKKHKPKFNILLRDDKSFPFIFIGNKDKWPQIKRHRGKKTKEGFYFGPFASAGSANWTIKMIQKIFHLRVCDDTVFKNRERPCILYQIKRCSGPCVGYVKKEDYNQTVNDAIEFVSGKSRKIQKNLSNQMEKASDDLDFEKAVILRDRIKALNIIQSSQRINEANLVEADVIAGYKESGKTCIQVFFYRSKQNWGNQAFFPKHDPDEKFSEILNSFVSQFYENKSVPSSVILSEEIKEKALIEKTLTQKEGKQINISVAKKGSKLKFKDSNLLDVDLINKRGKIMIINFWATWCAPCRKVMPSLEKLGTKLPEIDIFAVNMEKPNNLKVDKFFKDIGVKNLKTYYDPELRLVKGFKLRGLPTSILINKEGKEFGKVIGEIDFASDEFINFLRKYI